MDQTLCRPHLSCKYLQGIKGLEFRTISPFSAVYTCQHTLTLSLAMAQEKQAPVSAADSSFDNTRHMEPLKEGHNDAKLTTEEQHAHSKDGGSTMTGGGSIVNELVDTTSSQEYQQFLTLHNRFHGSQEWRKTLMKIDVSNILHVIHVMYH